MMATATMDRRNFLASLSAFSMLLGCNGDEATKTPSPPETGPEAWLDAGRMDEATALALAGTPWEGQFDGLWGQVSGMLDEIAAVWEPGARLGAAIYSGFTAPILDGLSAFSQGDITMAELQAQSNAMADAISAAEAEFNAALEAALPDARAGAADPKLSALIDRSAAVQAAQEHTAEIRAYITEAGLENSQAANVALSMLNKLTTNTHKLDLQSGLSELEELRRLLATPVPPGSTDLSICLQRARNAFWTMLTSSVMNTFMAVISLGLAFAAGYTAGSAAAAAGLAALSNWMLIAILAAILLIILIIVVAQLVVAYITWKTEYKACIEEWEPFVK
jgi:hypothetical protein